MDLDQEKRLEKMTEALEESTSLDVVVLNELMTEKSLKYVREQLSLRYPYRTEVLGKKCYGPMKTFFENLFGSSKRDPEKEMDSMTGDCSDSSK